MNRLSAAAKVRLVFSADTCALLYRTILEVNERSSSNFLFTFCTSVLKLKHNLTRLKHEDTTGKTGVCALLANIQPSGETRLTLRRKTSAVPHSCRCQSPSEVESEEFGYPWEQRVREGWREAGNERRMARAVKKSK